MKKYVSILLILAFSILLFASCGKTIEPHLHEYTEWGTVSETECGQICKECGHIISELHTFDEREVILKEATYTETGTKSRTCNRCGYVKYETIPKLKQPNDGSLPWDEF